MHGGGNFLTIICSDNDRPDRIRSIIYTNDVRFIYHHISLLLWCLKPVVAKGHQMTFKVLQKAGMTTCIVLIFYHLACGKLDRSAIKSVYSVTSRFRSILIILLRSGYHEWLLQ